MTLSLYVWTQFCPDYTDGLAFAIAETEEHARQLVTDQLTWEPSDWGKVQVLPHDQPIGFGSYGGS